VGFGLTAPQPFAQSAAPGGAAGQGPPLGCRIVVRGQEGLGGGGGWREDSPGDRRWGVGDGPDPSPGRSAAVVGLGPGRCRRRQRRRRGPAAVASPVPLPGATGPPPAVHRSRGRTSTASCPPPRAPPPPPPNVSPWSPPLPPGRSAFPPSVGSHRMQVSAPTRVPSSLGPFPSQMAMGWGESEGFLPKWFHSFSCASTVNPRLGFHRPNGGTPLRRNAPIFEQTISFTGSLQGSVPEIPHGPSPARAVASGPVPQRTAVLRSNFFCSFSCMFFRLGLQQLFEVGVGWPTVCARFLKGSSRFASLGSSILTPL